MGAQGVNAMSQNLNRTEVRDGIARSIQAEARDLDDDGEAFLEVAAREVVDMIVENLSDWEGRLNPTDDDYRNVQSLLMSENIRDVDVRGNGEWAAPKVTVWLSGDVPVWGNSAQRREFKFSAHQEHYNGRPTLAILDVRPF